MEENSLTKNLELTEGSIPESSAGIAEAEPEEVQPVIPLRKLYFINEIVEWQLTKYIWSGCAEVALRDMIMSHASELIRQIIRKQGLHTIYPGQDESSFGDLLQTAWVQIERTLYKYRSRPHCRRCFNPDRPADSLLYHPGEIEYGIKTFEEVIAISDKCNRCKTMLSDGPIIEPVQNLYAGSATILYRGTSKVFNMWSQIARTVILAHIKKEGRDRKNSGSYVSHLGTKQKPVSGVLIRFLNEMRELNKYHHNNLTIIKSLENIITTDDRPYDGLITKLVDDSGLSRAIITEFLRVVKLRSFELTDSLLNKNNNEYKIDNRKSSVDNEEE